MDKLILTAAVTGAMTMPTQTLHLPLTPQQIIDDAVACTEAGAASIHVHARDPQTAQPTHDQEVFGALLRGISERCDAVVVPTTGGGVLMTPEQRLQVVSTWRPEMATCNMGSINFSIHRVARRYRSEDWKYDWEESYVKGTENHIFPNTFRSIRHFIDTMNANDTRPEFELYDVGHIYNLEHFIRQGIVRTPIWLQFVLGVTGGIRATIYDLVHMLNTADRVIGRENYNWSVIGVGYPQEFEIATTAMFLGGHVRVGLEDNLFVRRRQLASNAELVTRMRQIAAEFERELATPAELRDFLGLKGLDAVAY